MPLQTMPIKSKGLALPSLKVCHALTYQKQPKKDIIIIVMKRTRHQILLFLTAWCLLAKVSPFQSFVSYTHWNSSRAGITLFIDSYFKITIALIGELICQRAEECFN